MKLFPFTMHADGVGQVGAGVLAMDLDDDSEPRGLYATYGDESWTEDLETVVAMQHLQYPGARLVPSASLEGDLPSLPEDLQGLDFV